MPVFDVYAGIRKSRCILNDLEGLSRRAALMWCGTSNVIFPTQDIVLVFESPLCGP